MQLKRGQKLDLQVSVTAADRAMRLLEALLFVAEMDGLSASEGPDAAAAKLLALSRHFRKELAQLADDLGLVREGRDLRSLLMGQIERAQDCFDWGLIDGLGGYGGLDPEAEAYLRPRVAELIMVIKEMAQVAGRVRPRSI